jgi:hypothetical protein
MVAPEYEATESGTEPSECFVGDVVEWVAVGVVAADVAAGGVADCVVADCVVDDGVMDGDLVAVVAREWCGFGRSALLVAARVALPVTVGDDSPMSTGAEPPAIGSFLAGGALDVSSSTTVTTTATVAAAVTPPMRRACPIRPRRTWSRRSSRCTWWA